MLPSIEEIRAELCRRSLYEFLIDFWIEINTDDLYLNWHLKIICDEVQTILERVIVGDIENDDLLVNISPGSTKSTIISQISLAWVWIRMPHCIGIFSTISTKNAEDFSRKFRDIVTSDKYKKYYPTIEIRHDSSALATIRNTLGGGRLQYTTHGRKTGLHGHFIVVDDNMAFEDARSDVEAERCNEALKGLLTREKKNARVPKLFFMQMQSQIDTTQWVLEKFPEIRRIVLPAYDNGKVHPPELSVNYIDGLMNPRHMNQKFLDNKKLQLGDLQYLAEYGQDCETSEGYMYHIQKINDMPKRGVSIAVCDPADDGECFLASVFAYIHSNKVYVHDVIYTQKDSDETITRNAEKARLHKPYAFYIENDGLGSIYRKGVKAKYALVQPFNAKGNKDDRIFSKANIINNFFVFHAVSPSLEYENAVNHLINYKKVGVNKYKDFEDVLTSLADLAIKNNLINIYD